MSDRVVLPCPGCGAKLAIDPSKIGKKLKCPKCAHVFVGAVPGSAPTASKPAATTAAKPTAPAPKPPAAALKAAPVAKSPPIFDEDDDDLPSPKPSAPAKPASAPKPAPVAKSPPIFDEDEEDAPPPPPAKSAAKPAGKPAAAPKANPLFDEDNFDDEEEVPKRPAKAPAKPAVAKKPNPFDDADDDEAEGDDDGDMNGLFDDDEAPAKPAAKGSGKAAAGKSATGKGSVASKKKEGGRSILPLALGFVVLLSGTAGAAYYFNLGGLFGTPSKPAINQVAKGTNTTPTVNNTGGPANTGDGTSTDTDTGTGNGMASNTNPGTTTPATPGTPTTPVASKNSLDLSWLPDNVELVVYIRVSDILQSDLVKPMLEPWVDSPAFLIFEKTSGIKPQDIESITIGLADLAKIPTNPAAVKSTDDFQSPLLVIFRTTKPIDLESAAKSSPQPFEMEMYKDRPLWKGVGSSIYVPADGLYVVGKDADVKAVADRGAGTKHPPALAFLDGTQHLLIGGAPRDGKLLEAAQKQLPEDAPAWAKEMSTALQSLKGAAVGISLVKGVQLGVTIPFGNASDATKMNESLLQAIAMMLEEFEQQKETLPPPALEYVDHLVKNLTASEKNSVVTVSTSLPESVNEKLAQLPGLIMSLASAGGPPGAGVDFGEKPKHDPVEATGVEEGIKLQVDARRSPITDLDGKKLDVVRVGVFVPTEGSKVIGFKDLVGKKAATELGELNFSADNTFVSSLILKADPLPPFEKDGGLGFLVFLIPKESTTATEVKELEIAFTQLVGEPVKKFKIPHANLSKAGDDVPELKEAGFTSKLGPGSNGERKFYDLKVKAEYSLSLVKCRKDEEDFPSDGFAMEDDEGVVTHSVTFEGDKAFIEFTLYKDVKSVPATAKFAGIKLDPLPKPAPPP